MAARGQHQMGKLFFADPVGSLSRFLDVNTIFLETSSTVLEQVEVTRQYKVEQQLSFPE
jgi:hypothetical protein